MNVELSGRSIVSQCFRRVGRVWPAAALLLILANIVTEIMDNEAGTLVDNDRAFDKVGTVP